MSDSSNYNDSYPNGAPTHRPPTLRARTDEQGYVIRRSVLEEGMRPSPECIIPEATQIVYGMMKRIGRFLFFERTDGFLQSLFFPLMSPFHQPPIILPVASHLITGFLSSQLDLIRTRSNRAVI